MEEQKQTKHASLFIIICIAIIALIAGTFLFLHRPQTTNSTIQHTAQAQTTTITYTGVKGKSALDTLKTKAQVVTKTSQYGDYVDSINGVKGGTNAKYWAFYVNGKLSDIGAGAYAATGGETITWKFE